MTGVSKWKLVCLAGALCLTFCLLYAILWYRPIETPVISPIAGFGFGLSLSLGIGWIPFMSLVAVAAWELMALWLPLDPRVGLFTISLGALLLAIAVKAITHKTGPSPVLARRNEVLWFAVGTFCFAVVWGAVEATLVEGPPRILWSSVEVDRLARRVFNYAAVLLTLGSFAAVFVGPWIRWWLGLTPKSGPSLNGRELRDTLIVVILFGLGFRLPSILKIAWQAELYYLCLLPLFYFAAQRGMVVTVISVFGCTVTAALLWIHTGISSSLQLADLRTLLASFAMTALVIAGQAGEQIHSFRLQGDLVRQLRRLTAHLESVREEEQTRIAREVHDELGGLLTGLKLDLAMMRRQLSPLAGERVVEECHRLSASVDTIIGTVQRIAMELRPGVLDNLGLAAAVQWMAQDFERRTGAHCIANPVEEIPAGKEVATAVYRILQEALTNVSRHAGAKEVHISLTLSGSSLELLVEDDGSGIPDEYLRATESLGVTGMRERAAALGGELKIDRRAAGGTVVRARIPMMAPRRAGASL